MKAAAVQPTPVAPEAAGLPPLPQAAQDVDTGPTQAHLSPHRRALRTQLSPAPRRLRPSAPSCDDAGVLDRSFAEVRAAVNIVDEDPARAEATRRLLELLAAQLGLRADSIMIRVNGEAANRTVRRQADGVMAEGVVYLHPQAYDPTTRAGTHLLAHEVAHVAQQALPSPALPSRHARLVEAMVVEAEVEAEALADTFASTRTARRVVAPLPLEATAANTDFDVKFRHLMETVRSSHSAEIDEIVSLLSYGVFDWAVTDDDVAETLHLLALVPMLVARAMAHGIGGKYRRRLIDNLSPSHYRTHRSEILAVEWAWESADEWAGVEHKLLIPLRLTELDPLEAAAVAFIFGKMSEVGQKAVLADPKRALQIKEIQEYAQGKQVAAELGKSLDEAQKEEEASAEARRTTDPSLKGLADDIITTLDKLIVRDEDALRLLDRIVKECLIVVEPSGKFRALVNAIGDGMLDELIDQIPVKGLYAQEKRRKAFVYLLSTRPPFKNGQIAEELLESPWWQFWNTVTSEEAFLAFLLVKAMPPRARTAFFRSHEGEQWSKVLSELPVNIKESEAFNFYTGGEEQKDRQSILVQLVDDALWTAEKKAQLDAVIRMAMAAGEGQFVFQQSQAHAAHLPEKGLDDIVRKYNLYDPNAGRTIWQETTLKGHAWYEEGMLGAVGKFFQALDFLFSIGNIDLSLKPPGVTLEGVDLAEVQDIFGGSLKGARFRRSSRQERQKAHERGETAANLAGVKWDNATSTLDVNVPLVELERLAYPSDDMHIRTGRSSLHGVHFHIRYAPSGQALPSLLAEIKNVVLNDVAIVFPDSMLSVNRMTVTNVHVTLASTDKQFRGSFFDAILGTPGPTLELILTFDGLRLEGVATSGGTFIQAVDISTFALQAGGDTASYARGLQASARRLDERLIEERALAEQATDPDERDKHRDAMARLQRQSAKVQSELQEQRAAGSVMDVGGITLTGFAGVSDKPIVLTDVHGQGRSVTAILPLLSDSTKLRNMIVGEQNVPTLRERRRGEETFEIDIGLIEADDLRLPSAIPTAAQAKKDFDTWVAGNAKQRTQPTYEATRAALEARALRAKKYEALASIGTQNLTPDQVIEFRDLRRWLKAFEDRRALTIEHLAVQGAAVTLDAVGQVGMQADAILVQNIRTFTPTGDLNLQLREISGEAVDVSAVMKGGVAKLADFKEYRKNLERAEITAQRLTLLGIQHAGTGAVIEELTFAGEGKDAGLAASLERGEGGATTIGVQSRRVIARGVSMPAYAALLGAELERLQALPRGELTQDERKRIDTIQAMLKDLADIQARQKKAEDALSKAPIKNEREAAAKQLARSSQDLKDWEQRLVINQLTIEHLSVTISGLGNVLAEDYDFDAAAKGMTIEGRAGDQRWFERAEVEGVRTRTATGEQVVADKIVAGAMRGKFIRTPKGFKLEKFGLDSLAVRGVSYATSKITLQSTGESKLVNIEIDAEVASTQGQQEITLTRIRVGRIIADGLNYEDDDKRVSVRSGELGGVLIEGMQITLPDDPKKPKAITGKVSVDEVKSLSLNAVAGGYRVDATLNSAEPKAAAAMAKALKVDFAKSGDITVGLAGLSAAVNVTELTTGSRVHVQLKRLSGTVIKSGDNYSIKGLSLGELTLSNAHWVIKDKIIEVRDRVTLQDITVDAEASLRPKKQPSAKNAAQPNPAKAEEAKEEKELGSLVFTRLVVNDIEAKDVQVTIAAKEEDKAKGITASPQKTFHLEQARLLGLTLTGFDVLNMRGKAEIARSISVTNLRATVGQIGKEEIKRATVSLTAYGKHAEEPGKGGRELSVTLLGKDGTIIRLGRIDEVLLTDIAAGKLKPGTPYDKLQAGVTASRARFGAITTEDIVIKDDRAEVNGIEIENIHLGMTDVISEKSGAKMHMTSADIPNKFRINQVVATFKKTGSAGKETTEIDTVTVEGIAIEKVIAKDLSYDGPVEMEGKAAKKTVVTMREATLEGFVLNRLSKNFAANTLAVDAKLRSVKVGEFALWLEQTVDKKLSAKKFMADVSTGEIRVNVLYRTFNAGTKDERQALEEGYYEIDQIALRRLRGYISEPGKEQATLGHDTRFKDRLGKEEPGIDVKGIRHDKSGTTIGSITGRGFVYRDPNLGLTLDIREAKVPDKLVLPPDGAFTLKYAEINDAYFRIDNVLALKGGDAGGQKSGAGDSIKYLDILDRVNGTFVANVYVPIHITDVGGGYAIYVRQQVFPVDITITDGKFNYEEAEDRALWSRNDLLVSLEMDGDQLALELLSGNLFTWTPGGDVEKGEMKDEKLVRLKRIILPDPKKEEEEKQEGGTPWVDPNQIELRDINANLGLKGYFPIDLGKAGRIALGTKDKDAVSGLKLVSESTQRLTWSLKALNASVEELHLANVGKLKGAEIAITDVDPASIEFDAGKVLHPRKLEGTIKQATVRNLSFEPTEKPAAPGGKPR